MKLPLRVLPGTEYHGYVRIADADNCIVLLVPPNLYQNEIAETAVHQTNRQPYYRVQKGALAVPVRQKHGTPRRVPVERPHRHRFKQRIGL